MQRPPRSRKPKFKATSKKSGVEYTIGILPADGKASIKGVIIDGEPWQLEGQPDVVSGNPKYVKLEDTLK